jgi:glycosyltransferase involved in cell wall biosynthesis
MRPQKATISACIIARDEASRLPDCLRSVHFCDEIVLVDSGSSDDTIKIARAAGARVVEQSWLGFPAQRNVALDHAPSDWVLEIDADERVTPALAREIVAFLSADDQEAKLGALPLRNIFLGRPLGPSAKYPEYRRRLLRRGSYRHDENRTVHEALIPHGIVHPFASDLEHILASTLREAVVDAWSYARLEAGQMQSSLTLVTFIRGALLRPPVKFVYRLFVDGGWRDGWPGVLKVAIDCAIDAMVWIRHLLGRRGDRLGRSGVSKQNHYGATNFRAGPPRIVGVAFGARQRARALSWLGKVAVTGVDVALLSDCQDSAGAAVRVRVRSLAAPVGPLTLIRSLDAEEQLRTIDAIVLFGKHARMLMRLVPSPLRGAVRCVEADSDPQTAGEFVAARLVTMSASPPAVDPGTGNDAVVEVASTAYKRSPQQVSARGVHNNSSEVNGEYEDNR